jgi:hypothetical protein
MGKGGSMTKKTSRREAKFWNRQHKAMKAGIADALRDEKLWKQMPRLLDSIGEQVKFKGDTFTSFCELLVFIDNFRDEMLEWAQKEETNG